MVPRRGVVTGVGAAALLAASPCRGCVHPPQEELGRGHALTLPEETQAGVMHVALEQKL